MLSRSAEERLGPRHREVLDELESMLLSHGFAAFTIRDLAAGVGCSRRTLYEIAPSKEQLVLIVIDRFLHRKGREAMSEIDDDDPVADQLAAYVRGGLKNQLEPTLLEDLADDAPARRLVDRHYRFAMTVVERLISLGIERGEFRRVDPAVMAATLAGASLYMSHPEILDDIGLDAGEVTERMLDAILPALRPGSKAQSPP